MRNMIDRHPISTATLGHDWEHEHRDPQPVTLPASNVARIRRGQLGVYVNPRALRRVLDSLTDFRSVPAHDWRHAGRDPQPWTLQGVMHDGLFCSSARVVLR